MGGITVKYVSVVKVTLLIPQNLSSGCDSFRLLPIYLVGLKDKSRPLGKSKAFLGSSGPRSLGGSIRKLQRPLLKVAPNMWIAALFLPDGSTADGSSSSVEWPKVAQWTMSTDSDRPSIVRKVVEDAVPLVMNVFGSGRWSYTDETYNHETSWLI
ncbi:uncharacterized protein H6S33_001976 [Morchella sextelata]|uniref:uncharacterized protein n=1 Tax=Morchella sextelata TaxID=1174677 RepID=UPI001D0377BF|nr:uncharacterized protein H6S33_001976 [Morchella sextelata]KAH0607924.1 hypothetical protein H6S33_001976 [Morchella sextelata]